MNYKEIGLGIAVVLVIVFSVSLMKNNPLGSVSVSNDYQSTSTKNVSGTILTDRILMPAGGTLARVTVMGAAAGAVTLCDATTTNASLRATATSSLNCFSIPASAAAGVYDFDAVLKDGLIIDTEATAPTSTVMWR